MSTTAAKRLGDIGTLHLARYLQDTPAEQARQAAGGQHQPWLRVQRPGLEKMVLRCKDGIELGDTSVWSTTIGG
jgi:hypothetical protein